MFDKIALTTFASWLKCLVDEGGTNIVSLSARDLGWGQKGF